jgi:hypothetical protein
MGRSKWVGGLLSLVILGTSPGSLWAEEALGVVSGSERTVTATGTADDPVVAEGEATTAAGSTTDTPDEPAPEQPVRASACEAVAGAYCVVGGEAVAGKSAEEIDTYTRAIYASLVAQGFEVQRLVVVDTPDGQIVGDFEPQP